MRSFIAYAALVGQALVSAQNPPAATPSNAAIIQGAVSYGGPVIPGTTGKLGNAQPAKGNPAGVTYTATLPNSLTSNIRGSVSISGAANGTGVQVSVSLSGFPSSSLGPFLYHIHVNPIPANGNCTAAGAHLDPYMRGEVPPCDSTKPATCQVGDLAGKWGNITTNPFTAKYYDPYVSIVPGNNASLVGKSIVIHSANATRLTCANFVLANSTNTTNSTTGKPLPYSSANGASGVQIAGLGAFAAGFVALAAAFL